MFTFVLCNSFKVIVHNFSVIWTDFMSFREITLSHISSCVIPSTYYDLKSIQKFRPDCFGFCKRVMRMYQFGKTYSINFI